MKGKWIPTVFYDRFGSEVGLNSLVFFADASPKVQIGKIVKINAGTVRIRKFGRGDNSAEWRRKSGDIVKLTDEYAVMYHLSM